MGSVDAGGVLLPRKGEPLPDAREALARGGRRSGVAGRADCAASSGREARPGALAYIRFHFVRGSNGKYSVRELRVWAERISRAPVDVYVYFNNDWDGFAVENARTLRSFLRADSA